MNSYLLLDRVSRLTLWLYTCTRTDGLNKLHINICHRDGAREQCTTKFSWCASYCRRRDVIYWRRAAKKWRQCRIFRWFVGFVFFRRQAVVLFLLFLYKKASKKYVYNQYAIHLINFPSTLLEIEKVPHLERKIRSKPWKWPSLLFEW